jgi:hypothetical protein
MLVYAYLFNYKPKKKRRAPRRTEIEEENIIRRPGEGGQEYEVVENAEFGEEGLLL